jgi:dimeric dUTPase (all-alpha-NTP-PPase superfamily)
VNLTKLFETQKLLRDRINYNEPDRFNKLILALLVELGECANEWRGFKFWSKNQEPRIKEKCTQCKGKGFYEYFDAFEMFESQYSTEPCADCEGTGSAKDKNPLLEEYADCLHFVLDLGIELEFEEYKINPFRPRKNIIEQFQDICIQITFLTHEYRTEITTIKHTYKTMFGLFLGLGEMLGFTWEQIEQAYFEKNAINHKRQEEGY